jgi:phage terminase large subunit
MAQKEIRFSELCNLTTKQWDMIEASNTSKFVFFGGARGGGKSYGLRWAAVYLALYYFTKYNLRNVRLMIACENYPALHDRQLVKIRYEYPEWLGVWKATEKEFHLHPAYGGGQICFRNLDAPEKYHSSEWGAILVDELPLNADNVFASLRTILRWKGLPDQECRFIGTGNPCGVGLGWVKRLWIDRVYEDGDDPAQYAFVQSFATDNPHIDPGYIRSLQLLPEREREAMLYGRWDVFEGQFFPEWDPKVHVVEPFPIPRGLGRWYRSLDWGEKKPSSVNWWWLSPDQVLYMVRELYEGGMKPSQLAERIKAMTFDGESVLWTVADPSIFGRRDLETGRSIADILHARGIPVLPGMNARVPGWQILREWLRVTEEVVTDPATGGQRLLPTSRFRVFSNCRDFIRTLPNLVYDERNPEDCNTNGEDHAGDSARYLCAQLGIAMAVPAPPAVASLDPEDAWRIAEGLRPRSRADQGADAPFARSTGW